MRPDDLVAQARRLAKASAMRPRDVDLRRAVSAAYYAVFHAIARAGADLLVGTVSAQRSEKAWRQVYRSLQHGEAKSRCQNLPASFPQELADVAEAFVALQKLRHDADYDPDAAFLRRDVQSHILQAETALTKLRTAPIADRRAFVVWLLFANRRTG
jgi:uncharacterized protein (UPF0332 family)